eukprot:351612-Chlamydomonas_euryale.AAC.9
MARRLCCRAPACLRRCPGAPTAGSREAPAEDSDSAADRPPLTRPLRTRRHFRLRFRCARAVSSRTQDRRGPAVGAVRKESTTSSPARRDAWPCASKPQLLSAARHAPRWLLPGRLRTALGASATRAGSHRHRGVRLACGRRSDLVLPHARPHDATPGRLVAPKLVRGTRTGSNASGDLDTGLWGRPNPPRDAGVIGPSCDCL